MMDSKPKKSEPIPENEEDIIKMCKKALKRVGEVPVKPLVVRFLLSRYGFPIHASIRRPPMPSENRAAIR